MRMRNNPHLNIIGVKHLCYFILYEYNNNCKTEEGKPPKTRKVFIMKQMVYVVLDNGEVVGVYDEYVDAEAVASETATITPVIVGQTDDCRVGCETPSEVVTAMEHELQNLANPYSSDEDEDEDDEDDEEDDDYDDEDEDEEEETDPIEELIYEVDGKSCISKEDADSIMRMILITLMVNGEDEDMVDTAGEIFIKLCEEYGIEGIDDEGE